MMLAGTGPVIQRSGCGPDLGLNRLSGLVSGPGVGGEGVRKMEVALLY